MCRSRRELSNEYLLAKFGFDPAENEPCKVCPLSAYRSPRFATFASQRRFEKEVHEKVSKLGNLSDAEAVLVDDCLILVRDFGDTNIIVVANQYENELLLLDFLNALHTVVGNIAAGQSKAAVLECLDKIFVMLDEVCDRGLILETNAATLTNRINMAEDEAPDQSFQAAFSSVREQMLGSIRRG